MRSIKAGYLTIMMFPDFVVEVWMEGDFLEKQDIGDGQKGKDGKGRDMTECEFGRRRAWEGPSCLYSV